MSTSINEILEMPASVIPNTQFSLVSSRCSNQLQRAFNVVLLKNIGRTLSLTHFPFSRTPVVLLLISRSSNRNPATLVRRAFVVAGKRVMAYSLSGCLECFTTVNL